MLQALKANPAAAPAARPMGQDLRRIAPLGGFSGAAYIKGAFGPSDGSEKRAYAPMLPSASHRRDPFMQTPENTNAEKSVFNDINTPEGLMADLREIMQEFNRQHSQHVNHDAMRMTVTENLQRSNEIYNEAMRRVFDTVHASEAWM